MGGLRCSHNRIVSVGPTCDVRAIPATRLPSKRNPMPAALPENIYWPAPGASVTDALMKASLSNREQPMNSQEALSPEGYDWDAKPPVSNVALPA